MKKSAICITLATLALAGCNNDEKNAQARLDNARCTSPAQQQTRCSSAAASPAGRCSASAVLLQLI